MSFLSIVKNLLVLPNIVKPTGYNDTVLKDVLIVPEFFNQSPTPAAAKQTQAAVQAAINSGNTVNVKAWTSSMVATFNSLSSASDKYNYYMNINAQGYIPPTSIGDQIAGYVAQSSGLTMGLNSSLNKTYFPKTTSMPWYNEVSPALSTGPSTSAGPGSSGGTTLNWTSVVDTGITALPGLINAIFNGGGKTTTSTTVTPSSSSTGSQTLLDYLGLSKALSNVNVNPSVTFPTWAYFLIAGVVGVFAYLLFKLTKKRRR